MSLTIEELKAKIQFARKQLILSAKVWVDSEDRGDLSDTLRNWLDALKAPNSDNLEEELQRRDLPFVREDSFSHPENNTSVSTQMVLDSLVEKSAQDQPTTIRSYKYTLEQSGAIWDEMCFILTLIEQLHQMEECLTPIEPLVRYKSLELALAMAIGINSEWRFVEPGIQTVRSYKQRLDLASAQLRDAEKVNLSALELMSGQISLKISQFKHSLEFFTSLLSEAFPFEKDNRWWFVRKVTSYIPWHNMLHTLAINLFEKGNVVHSEELALSIEDTKLESLNASVKTELQKPFMELIKHYSQLSESTRKELGTVRFKLDAMATKINTMGRFGTERLFALYVPTMALGPFGFFHRMQALTAPENLLDDNEARTSLDYGS